VCSSDLVDVTPTNALVLENKFDVPEGIIRKILKKSA